MKNKIIVIAGPTAVGKTKFAIEVARHFDGEIVSCDSMQLYKYMDIGSAKPSASELAMLPHHLVDIIDPRQPFSAAEYHKLAKEAISDIFSRQKTPVISGGTGLYLNSLIYEMDFSGAQGDLDYRRELEKLAEEKGAEVLHALLKQKDPDAAALIHPNNVKRTIRALDRIKSGEGNVRAFTQVKQPVSDYDVVLCVLTRDRAELYNRINMRVDMLIDAGLVNEVRSLMDMGLTSGDISMMGIGYKEIIEYLNGDCDLETAVDKVKINTRHYAKRQLTWYRRYDKIKWLNISEYRDDAEAIQELITWLENEM